jgi:hypothetical protein
LHEHLQVQDLQETGQAVANGIGISINNSVVNSLTTFKEINIAFWHRMPTIAITVLYDFFPFF